MPSFPVVISSLLIPTAAVLAGIIRPAEPILRRVACKSTYTSQSGDTCTTIDQKYSLVSGTILAANSFLTCSDIWANTPICVPDGPYACSETYYSKKGDTCGSIETLYDLAGGEILASNSFLNCNDIWENTPICIPADDCSITVTTGTSTPITACKSLYLSVPGDTCDSLDQKFNLASGTIKAANSFVTCNNIWAGTQLCILDSCTTQPYTSQANDTCDSIEAEFGLVSGSVKLDNSFVTCNDIWTGTPLTICVPQ